MGLRLSADELLRVVQGGHCQIAKGSSLSPSPVETAAARVERLEYEMQAAVIERCTMMAALKPEYALIFAVPNDMVRPGVRVTPGLKAGVPDLMFPVARGGYHGMFIELKVGRNQTSDVQEWWAMRLRAEGFYCVVERNDPEEVMRRIEEYMQWG